MMFTPPNMKYNSEFTIQIDAPRPELFADLVGDEWVWINGCYDCLGNGKNY